MGVLQGCELGETQLRRSGDLKTTIPYRRVGMRRSEAEGSQEWIILLLSHAHFEVSIVDTRCICAHALCNRDSVQKMGWQRMPPLPGC